MTTAIEYHIEEIFHATGGKKWITQPGYLLEYLSLDSRKIIVPAKTIFWALNTHSRNASAFIPELYNAGVRNFVTDQKPDLKKIPDANVIIVKDTLKALQGLAVSHRKRFKKIHVIAITGSNGKTIVKEWLSDFLSKDHLVVKNPRSYNSQIGVALSILQIRKYHTLGIFEAGISQKGEMANLQRMIRPHTGVFTNIGSAHDEGFDNRKQKISEKLLLFKSAKQLIYPASIRQIAEEMNSLNPGVKLFSWGKHEAYFSIRKIRKKYEQSDIFIYSKKGNISFTIPFTDTAYIENAITCYSTLETISCFRENMAAEFKNLSSVPMRLELMPGINASVIINDTYNNDLQSLSIALDFLAKQTNRKKVLILSDILQSGIKKDQLYKRVSLLLKSKPPDVLIGVGKDMQKFQSLFSYIHTRSFYENTAALIPILSSLPPDNAAILIKGARSFAFEKVAAKLEAQMHQTRLTINLSNLLQNISVYKSLLHRGTKLMMMVKAFAYGSGSREIASLLQFTKVDYLAVAYPDEGIALRNAGINLPVMVMNTDPMTFESLINYSLEPEIFSFKLLYQFSQYLSFHKIEEYPVHLKIDTGMHRLGFEKKQIGELIQALQKNKSLRVKSVFSHLSASDEPAHDRFTKQQYNLFNSVVNQLRKNISYHFDCHIANTGAISRFPELQMDMVRLGIGMYGLDSNPEISKQLKVVNCLTTTISQIKKIKAGDVVGYGEHHVKKDKLIATVGIGYADGYPRSLGMGNGKMRIRNKIASTEGNICMDMTMLDITEIPEAREGDEVEVFGEHIRVQDVASKARTIPYEIFTGISGRVKRIYIEE